MSFFFGLFQSNASKKGGRRKEEKAQLLYFPSVATSPAFSVLLRLVCSFCSPLSQRRGRLRVREENKVKANNKGGKPLLSFLSLGKAVQNKGEYSVEKAPFCGGVPLLSLPNSRGNRTISSSRVHSECVPFLREDKHTVLFGGVRKAWPLFKHNDINSRSGSHARTSLKK